MPKPDESDFEAASVDEAVERMEEHEDERAAGHKQNLIQKETHRKHLDEG
ncbi:MAG: hypothetical protein K0U64_03385 [Actinomycetia bacterium]|nr:hypothetical protein [Actinomycetes bacterium]